MFRNNYIFKSSYHFLQRRVLSGHMITNGSEMVWVGQLCVGGLVFACHPFYNNCVYIESRGVDMNLTSQIMNLECYSSTDIVRKCKKYPQFLEELEEIEVGYSHDLNMAIYASLEDAEGLGVFQIQNQGTLFVSFFAYLMPPFEELASRFYLLWIRMLDETLRMNVGKKYNIIYHHSLCDSSYPYHFLVGIFKKLPIYYYAMLDKIYTVEATFFLRKSAGLFDFGRLYKLFERKLENIEKLSEFANIPQVAKSGLLDRLPERLMMQLQQKTKKKLMKEKALQPAKVQTPSLPPPPPKKQDCLTINLAVHKLDKNGIPVPLSILVNTLKKNITFLELEGIFRKSGSIEEEEEIIDELGKLNDGEELHNLAEYSGYAIAGVVKKFFTKLIAPVVPYSVYTSILGMLAQSTIKPEEEVSFILDFLNQLPPLNKKVTLYLLSFLKLDVISRQDKNKMNNYNMSVCFCPCVFRSESPTLADLLNSGKFAGILNIFFNRYEEIMGMQQRSSKDKEKLENTPKPTTKHWQAYRISMA